MKTMILGFFFLTTCLSVCAQQSIKDVEEVSYYGVDFSKVKIYRAKESVKDFQIAFQAINDLVQVEDRKYNFEKFFKKTVNNPSLAVVKKRNETHPPFMLPRKMSSRQLDAIRLSPEEVKEVIGSYGNEDNGVGVVVIAVLLNKDKLEASYEVVFFDVKTKAVLFEKEIVGKAGGAGLRNFWANSLHDALNNWKYKVK